MTLKIPVEKTEVCCPRDADNWQGVIVRAATWRKIMAVLKAADGWLYGGTAGVTLDATIRALHEHLERK